MRTIEEKIQFLKSVNTDELDDRIREPFLELQDASNNFDDEDLLEAMNEVVDELIDAVEEVQDVVIKEYVKVYAPAEIPPISAITPEADKITTEIVEMVADDSKVNVEGEKAPVTKPRARMKVINHSKECIELKDEFLELLRETIDTHCSPTAYPYSCSMAQTEQGFLQLATQVFDICIAEKDMSIKSALNILESETNAK